MPVQLQAVAFGYGVFLLAIPALAYDVELWKLEAVEMAADSTRRPMISKLAASFRWVAPRLGMLERSNSLGVGWRAVKPATWR